MKPHQERVIEEQKELQIKVDALYAFLSDPEKSGALDNAALDPAERDRMQRQLDCMIAYNGILLERIEAFGTATLPDEEENAPDSDDSSEEE